MYQTKGNERAFWISRDSWVKLLEASLESLSVYRMLRNARILEPEQIVPTYSDDYTNDRVLVICRKPGSDDGWMELSKEKCDDDAERVRCIIRGNCDEPV